MSETPTFLSMEELVRVSAETRKRIDEKVNKSKLIEGVKHDQGKPRMDLLPAEFLIRTAEVLTFGADKYAAHNWRKGMDYSRVYAALQRHLTAWNNGEDIDEESGLSHLAHAACCIAFLLSYTERGTGNDDRYKGE